MTEVLVPIFVCVVLPVSIVLIIYLASINKDNKRAQVLIKAIESNQGIDAQKLADALRKPQKTAREILKQRLLCGCIFTLIGVAVLVVNFIAFSSDKMLMLLGGVSLAIGAAYLIVYFVTRKQVED